LLVDVKRRVPAPETSSAVPEALTDKLSVPADSVTAPPAIVSTLIEENVAVPRASVPALTVVLPV
jgi:hypothetical protein